MNLAEMKKQLSDIRSTIRTKSESVKIVIINDGDPIPEIDEHDWLVTVFDGKPENIGRNP